MFGESTESQFTLNLPTNLVASNIAVWTTVSKLKIMAKYNALSFRNLCALIFFICYFAGSQSIYQISFLLELLLHVLLALLNFINNPIMQSILFP